MKFGLVVLSTGKMEGKTIPITSDFLVGRDPGCQLRPASPLISLRHCIFSVHESRAFVKDLGSTNGTFVNDEKIQSERQLASGDEVRVGPIVFRAKIQRTSEIRLGVGTQTDDDAGDLLLAMQDEPTPLGSTIMAPLTPPEERATPPPGQQPGLKAAPTDPSNAAKDLLGKYQRRNK